MGTSLEPLMLVFKGVVDRLFTKEALLHCICSMGVCGRVRGSVCKSRVFKGEVFSNVIKRYGVNGVKDILVKCYSISRSHVVGLGYLDGVQVEPLVEFFRDFKSKAYGFFKNTKGQNYLSRYGKSLYSVKLLYTDYHRLEIFEDGRFCFRFGGVAYHMWPISIFKDPLGRDCWNVVFFGVRDHVPHVGVIVVRGSDGNKVGFRLGEVDTSFAARLVVCRDGIVEFWVSTGMHHTTVYRLLRGLGKVLVGWKGLGDCFMTLGELSESRIVLAEVLARVTKEFQPIFLRASLKGEEFTLDFAVRGTRVDCALPYHLSARGLTEERIGKVLQGLRARVSSLYDLVLDRTLELHSISLRQIRDGLVEEFENVLRELENMNVSDSLDEGLEKRREELLVKLRQLSRGVLTWYVKTGSIRVESPVKPENYGVVVKTMDSIIETSIKAASEYGVYQKIVSQIKLREELAELGGL